MKHDATECLVGQHLPRVAVGVRPAWLRQIHWHLLGCTKAVSAMHKMMHTY